MGELSQKKLRGAPFYELLNNNTKTDGWVNTSLHLEVEFSEMDGDWQYGSAELKRVVSEINKPCI